MLSPRLQIQMQYMELSRDLSGKPSYVLLLSWSQNSAAKLQFFCASPSAFSDVFERPG